MFAEYHDLLQKKSYKINVDSTESGHLKLNVPVFYATLMAAVAVAAVLLVAVLLVVVLAVQVEVVLQVTESN